MIDDTTPAVTPRPQTFRGVLVASDEDHDLASQLALVALGKATGCSPRAAQRLLDGPVGAGLGTMVVSLTDEGDLALHAAIAEAIRRQQGWAFGHEDGMRYGLGYRGKLTVHGFRATASTVLNESGLWRPDAIERQLAHVPGDGVRAAYNAAQYMAERREMMCWYSRLLAEAGARV